MPKSSKALTLLPANLMILPFKRFYLSLCLFLYSFCLIYLWSLRCGDRTFAFFYIMPSLFSFYIRFDLFAYGHWDVVTKHFVLNLWTIY